MLEFTSPRTGFRWRSVAVPVCAVVLAYISLSSLNNGGRDIVIPPVVTADIASNEPLSHSDLPSVKMDTKPLTAPQQAETDLSSYIQSGIDNLLQAGSDFFVMSKKLTVGKGDTLMGLLVKNDVPREEAYQAIQALTKVYDPKDLNPSHEVTVFFHRNPKAVDAKFSGLQIEKDRINSVFVNRGDDGSYKVDQEAKEVYATLKAYKGKIDSSLYMSVKNAGIPDNIILDLIKMYSWGVDFQREIQPGDGFEVMYEEYKTEDGEVVPGKGNVVYAKLALGDRILPFYRYEDKNGDTDYYDETGQSAKKPLMKTPIDGARLSSGFGVRKHPVLGYNKMHKGLDFAAPRGTPIYAAGDGVIEKMGRYSSYGNYVRIRHKSGLATAYGHMNGFKSGLGAGSRVKQGQVIGYVGTTGRSTGPHLHYEVLVNGGQVNPSTVKMPTGKALKGKELVAFKGFVNKYDGAFRQAVHVIPTRVASK